MRPPCEFVVRHLLPLLRARIAKALMEEYGWSQMDVARALKVSQPAIAKHERILRREGGVKISGLDELVENLVEIIVKGELDDVDFIRDVCSFCVRGRMSGPICKYHVKEFEGLPPDCDVCTEVFIGESEKGKERREVIRNLSAALSMITSDPDFGKLVPEVRMNVVMCLKDAEGHDEVAGIPGRITVIGGKPFAASPPQFGASRHTADLLLTVRKSFPQVRSLLCTRYDEGIRKAAERSGLKVVFLRREGRSLLVEESLKGVKDPPDVLVDPGGWGVEPVAYVTGRNAIDVAEKARKLIE